MEITAFLVSGCRLRFQEISRLGRNIVVANSDARIFYCHQKEIKFNTSLRPYLNYHHTILDVRLITVYMKSSYSQSFGEWISWRGYIMNTTSCVCQIRGHAELIQMRIFMCMPYAIIYFYSGSGYPRRLVANLCVTE